MRATVRHPRTDEIIAAYLSGLGFKAAARSLGIAAPNTIKRCLIREGVPLRTEAQGKAVSPVYQEIRGAHIGIARKAKAAALRAWRRSGEYRRVRHGRRKAKAAADARTPEAQAKRRAYGLHRYHTNEQQRQREIWRSRLQKLIQRRQDNPARKMGCVTAAEFIDHIEQQWEEGMTWENYGRASRTERRWQIDHAIPVSRFDLTDSIEAAQCWHYSNMQPMWAEENIRKGARVTDDIT